MNCPVCNVELRMSERSGIEIDYCPKCRGIWLDRGELDKIIEQSSKSESIRDERSERESKDAFFHKEKHYKDEKYYKYKKGKSFLGDLFDF
ncbi:MAG: hypothetical protein DWQ44_03805 [Bacteroidetes bacterium]|nr:MAG: hypothetical protein DWQ33_00100 [Bacteroidota bacterium]REK00425.1 MAG: hypothetical protein DWQ39_11785 [Bacteroidota bacterium]REK05068.1 MAG: hypothetical protein DWQ39_07625 [Bacteroidota bacterium]REK35543.1 MAG: hypothetical protein DWQ44_03805 [Bacteroidota bacterium]REK51645.1 MAG: hypothetical protein DWQ48_00380 [Bacteroidota bacterium]